MVELCKIISGEHMPSGVVGTWWTCVLPNSPCPGAGKETVETFIINDLFYSFIYSSILSIHFSCKNHAYTILSFKGGKYYQIDTKKAKQIAVFKNVSQDVSNSYRLKKIH